MPISKGCLWWHGIGGDKVELPDLISLQTSAMSKDPTTVAFSYLLDNELKKIEPLQANIAYSLDSYPEDILDELALEKNIFWYDANASIQIKRNLIRNAEKVFKYLGTDYAVEEVIKDYFGDGEIQQWYDYGGQPFHFKVITSNPKVNDVLALQFSKAVNRVKRLSTRLEEVVVSMNGETVIYTAIALHTGDNITIQGGG